jgi:predicted metal-binding membrane protein
MIAFWIAVVVGVVVAVAYIALAVQAFLRVRNEVLAAGTTGSTDELDAGEIDQDGVFTWKAFGAVVISTAVIVLLGVNSVFWYLPAALAIGSSIAVVTAFVIDRRSTAKQGN